jgi:Ca2+-binding EF-hand superfamily protein
MGRFSVAGAVVLTLAASTAAAQGQGQGPGAQRLQQARARQQEALLQRLDKDGDGKISRAEWPREAQTFDRLDANKDEMLSGEEIGKVATARQLRMRQARARVVRARLRRLDTNKDHVISRDEWRGKPEVFDRLDANKDGQLTPAEIRQARAHRRRS